MSVNLLLQTGMGLNDGRKDPVLTDLPLHPDTLFGYPLVLRCIVEMSTGFLNRLGFDGKQKQGTKLP